MDGWLEFNGMPCLRESLKFISKASVVCIKEIIHLGSVGLSDKKIYLAYNLQQVYDNTVFWCQ